MRFNVSHKDKKPQQSVKLFFRKNRFQCRDYDFINRNHSIDADFGFVNGLVPKEKNTENIWV